MPEACANTLSESSALSACTTYRISTTLIGTYVICLCFLDQLFLTKINFSVSDRTFQFDTWPPYIMWHKTTSLKNPNRFFGSVWVAIPLKFIGKLEAYLTNASNVRLWNHTPQYIARTVYCWLVVHHLLQLLPNQHCLLCLDTLSWKWQRRSLYFCF